MNMHACRGLLLLIPILLAFSAVLAEEPGGQELVGTWTGEIKIPGSPLEIIVELDQDDNGWLGNIDIPAQGASGLPLTNIRVDGGSVEFAIEGIPGEPAFGGTLSHDRIEGSFTQGGQVFEFAMSRSNGKGADREPARRQEVFEDPEGRFTVPVPENWQAEERDGYLVLTDRDGSIHIKILVVEEADGEKAIEMAWERVDPEFGLEVTQILTPPSTSGVESTTVVNYDLPDERIYQGVARSFQGVNFVLLVAADLSAIQRRQAQITIIDSGLKIHGVEETDLSGMAPGSVDEIIDELESFIEEYREGYRIPGASIALVQDGRQVYGRGFGHREYGGDAAMTTDTLMMIGSTGKTLTTMLMASLVDEGIVDWDTPAIEVFADFAVADPELTGAITLRNLVCACTGVPRQDFEILFNSSQMEAADIIRSLGSFEFYTDFGEAFQYSNQLVATGGYLAALADGAELDSLKQGYSRALARRVLDPLGMTDTYSSHGQINDPGRASVPHQPALDTGEPRPMDVSGELLLESIMPAGSHWSTADDMARYMIAQMAGGMNADGEPVVSREGLEKLWEPQVSISSTSSYGLGWIVGEYKGLKELSHAGNTLGFSSEFSFLPEAGIGIVVLSNTRLANAFSGAVRQRFYELAFGLESGEAESGARFGLEQIKTQQEQISEKLLESVDSEEIQPWLGRFANNALGEIEISYVDDRLAVDAGEFKSELRPLLDRHGDLESYMSYTPPMAGLPLKFERDDNDRPVIRFGEGMSRYIFEPVDS